MHVFCPGFFLLEMIIALALFLAGLTGITHYLVHTVHLCHEAHMRTKAIDYLHELLESMASNKQAQTCCYEHEGLTITVQVLPMMIPAVHPVLIPSMAMRSCKFLMATASWVRGNGDRASATLTRGVRC